MENGRFGGSARRRGAVGSGRRVQSGRGCMAGTGRRFRPSARVCRRGAAGIARPVHAVGSGRWFGRPLRNGRECTAGAEPSVPSVGSVRPRTTKADCSNSRPSVTASPKLSVLERRLVRNGELLTSLGTTGRQNLASVGRSHTLTETMLIDSLPARGLVCSLHCHSCIVFIVLDYFTDCKSTTKKLSAKIFPENISRPAPKKRRILPIFIEK